jgi:nucleotide-binding universal stress UspA family protein
MAMARAFDAKLIGFSAAEVGEPFTFAAGLPPPLLDERREQLALCLETLRHNFLRLVEDIPSEWRSAMAPPVAFAADNARTADLLVLGRGTGFHVEEGFALPPAPLLVAAGRPVLVVPPGVEKLSADRVLVAWKDTRSARVAIQQALPLLARASHVTVLGVGEEVDQAQIDDVCTYLNAHGVEGRARWSGRGDRTAANVIIEAAGHEDADLIVSGGYSHARLVEWVIGGVTEELLTVSPYCCLMAH